MISKPWGRKIYASVSPPAVSTNGLALSPDLRLFRPQFQTCSLLGSILRAVLQGLYMTRPMRCNHRLIVASGTCAAAILPRAARSSVVRHSAPTRGLVQHEPIKFVDGANVSVPRAIPGTKKPDAKRSSPGKLRYWFVRTNKVGPGTFAQASSP